jgi:hypothetical protein
VFFVGAFAAFGFSPSVRAAVGDDVAVVAADQARWRASLRITAMKDYAIHELTSAVGTTVREYVGSSGKIFAVSWSGGWRPNLRDIMGGRYDQYIEATRGKRRGRGPVRVELPGMVVAMGGYLRTFWGHVVLTDLAPSGWQEETLGDTP